MSDSKQIPEKKPEPPKGCGCSQPTSATLVARIKERYNKIYKTRAKVF